MISVFNTKKTNFSKKKYKIPCSEISRASRQIIREGILGIVRFIKILTKPVSYFTL